MRHTHIGLWCKLEPVHPVFQGSWCELTPRLTTQYGFGTRPPLGQRKLGKLEPLPVAAIHSLHLLGSPVVSPSAIGQLDARTSKLTPTGRPLKDSSLPLCNSSRERLATPFRVFMSCGERTEKGKLEAALRVPCSAKRMDDFPGSSCSPSKHTSQVQEGNPLLQTKVVGGILPT